MIRRTPEHPFGKIALSLSGGGGRATGFHLGTLAYLERVNLLADVNILSSVSGGSFIAAKYALTLARADEDEKLEVTFRKFYAEYYDYLLSANLVDKALTKLSERDSRDASKPRNLILALADVYDEKEFLDGARFGDLWNGGKIHLEHIIFNATEFRTGIAFRFHKGPSDKRLSGNRFVPLSEDHARKARLADIVAASSCIPIGLEPIAFPQDFRWPSNEPGLCQEIQERIAYHCGSDTKSVSLMDGGVYDNQGFDAVTVALDPEPREILDIATTVPARFYREYGDLQALMSLGLFIISDTPLLDDNIFPAPDPDDVTAKRGSGWLTLGHLNLLSLGLVGLAILMLLTNSYDYRDYLELLTVQLESTGPRLDGRDLVFIMRSLIGFEFWSGGMPILFGTALIALVWSIRSKVKAFLLQFPESDESERQKPATNPPGMVKRQMIAWKRWRSISRLKVRVLQEMISLRVGSTWALTSAIFLNRIRSLGYSLVRNNDRLDKLLIRHEIYDIEMRENKKSKHQASSPMLEVTKRASALATQLWFDDESQLRDLVASGQITMCYNLLEHIDRMRKEEPIEEPGGDFLNKIYDNALNDWEALQDDPFCFVDKLEAPDTPQRVQTEDESPRAK